MSQVSAVQTLLSAAFPVHRCVVAVLEQSNGYSCLGGPPPDQRSLGKGGHVRNKDGTPAAMFVAELAAYAKHEGTTLLDLLDEKIYLDPEIGLYITHYEPDPIDGEYEGLAVYSKKRGILDKAEELYERCLSLVLHDSSIDGWHGQAGACP